MARDALIRLTLRHRTSAGFAASLVACLVAAASLRAAGGDAPGLLPPPPPPGLLPPPPPLLIQSGPPPQTTPVVQAAASSPDKKQNPKRATNDTLPPPRPMPSPVPAYPPPLRAETASDSTPRPTSEVEEEYAQFVDRRVDPRTTLDVVVGRQTLLVLKQKPNKVQLPDEKIAAYELISGKDLAVTGKAIGSTVLNLWFPDPKDATKEKILSYLVHVVPDPEVGERREACFRRLQDEINRKFPDSIVRLTLLNDKLLVCGQAKDGFEAQQILRVVGVNACPPPVVAADQVNLNVVNVNAGPNGPPSAGLGDFLVETPAGEKYTVVNLLHVPGDQQVLLRVTVAEINRTAARSIGVDFGALKQCCQEICGGGPTGVNGPAGALPYSIDNGRCVAAVNALKNLDFARILEEPTLTALNGQEASSHVGGQFPVPVVNGLTPAGLQGVSFVPFGVQLKFTPSITDKDLIRLSVSAEVSTRDNDATATIGNTCVPGLSTRNFQTTVELRAGQTLAVAGLIQNNFGVDASRVPAFGDLPVVGHLFGLDRTSAGEQELIVLITPELVHPLDKGECPPLPGGDVFEPGDLEFYLLGRLESRRPYDFRSPVRTDLSRDARYRHCEQMFIFGPQGYSDGKP